MFNGQYVTVKVGKKIITMWDGQRTFAFRGSHVRAFRDWKKKWFRAKKKKIKEEIKNKLDSYGISDKKLLRKTVKYHFDKFVESEDKTEIAKKSGKNIWTEM